MSNQSDDGWKTGPSAIDEIRDEKGRFRPGKSGNLEGRPPKKIRPVTESQLRADFLAICEKRVRSKEGTESPLIVELIANLFEKAMNGSDLRSGLKLLQIAREFLIEHVNANSAAQTLRDAESHLSWNPKQAREVEISLNKIRRATRPR